jgi:hypothetical protein
MSGGTISGNKAAGQGGVYVSGNAGSKLVMTGGTVYGSNASASPADLGNTAAGNGAALFVGTGGIATLKGNVLPATYGIIQ